MDWLNRLSPELRRNVEATTPPVWVTPMAATLTKDRFDDERWLFERKVDGFRFLAFVRDGEAQLLTRNKIRHRFPLIEATLLAQKLNDFIVDGEVVWGDRRTGTPRAAGDEASEYAVFDILRFDGHDVTQLPLYERKRLLEDEFGWVDPLTLVEPLPEPGIAAYERACREGWEGVMAKKIDSVYEHKRSRNWLKMKCDASQELVVGGYTAPSGQRSGFGALLVGYYDGDDFVYAGRVGTGFSNKLLDEMYAQMRAIEVDKAPFTSGSDIPRKDARWVRPEIVVEVAFMEWTSDNKMRHPRFVRIRHDKSPRDVVREDKSR